MIITVQSLDPACDTISLARKLTLEAIDGEPDDRIMIVDASPTRDFAEAMCSEGFMRYDEFHHLFINPDHQRTVYPGNRFFTDVPRRASIIWPERTGLYVGRDGDHHHYPEPWTDAHALYWAAYNFWHLYSGIFGAIIVHLRGVDFRLLQLFSALSDEIHLVEPSAFADVRRWQAEVAASLGHKVRAECCLYDGDRCIDFDPGKEYLEDDEDHFD